MRVILVAICIIILTVLYLSGCSSHTLPEFKDVQEGVYLTLDEASEFIFQYLVKKGFVFDLLEPYERAEISFTVDSCNRQRIAALVLVCDIKSFNIAIVDKHSNFNLTDFRLGTHPHSRSARRVFEKKYDIQIDFMFFNMGRFMVGGEEPLVEDIIAWRYEQLQDLIELLENVQK